MTSPRFPVSRRNFLKGCCAAAVASSVPALGWIDPAKAAGSGVQHDVLVYLFLRGGRPTAYFETSRGCPYPCGYCYTNSLFSVSWRGQSAATVRRAA